MPSPPLAPPSPHALVPAPVDPRGDVRVEARPSDPKPTFEEVYEEYLPFVWRSARRLGVQEAALEDIAQEVFVVVHRRLDEFEGRSALRTWIYGVLVRVVRDHRRTIRRKRLSAGDREGDDVLDALPSPTDSPHDAAARSDAVRVLHRLLSMLDDDKREVFVLAELEELTAKEIAEVTGVPFNTVYSRLRAARKAFDEALARHHAQEAAEVTAVNASPSERTFWGGLWSWTSRRRADTTRGRTS